MPYQPVRWTDALINISTPTEPQLTLMTLLNRRAHKMKLVSDWLETLPMHWAYEAGVHVKKPDLSVGIKTSDGKAQGGSVSDWKLTGRNEEGHEKIKANLEQKMKLVELEMRQPRRKRKMAFDVEMDKVRAGGLKAIVNANKSVKVEEAKKETVMGRPLKRVKRARKDVVVVAT